MKVMALISLPPATAAEREKGLFPANEGGTRCSPQVSTGTVWTGGLITTETKVLSLLPLTPRSLGRLMLGPPLRICVGGSLGFSLHLCSHDWGGGYRQDLWHLAGASGYCIKVFCLARLQFSVYAFVGAFVPTVHACRYFQVAGFFH